MARLTESQWNAIRSVWEYDPDEPSYEVAAVRAAEDFKLRGFGEIQHFRPLHNGKAGAPWSPERYRWTAHPTADAMAFDDGMREKQNEQNATRGKKTELRSECELVQVFCNESRCLCREGFA